MDTKELQDDVLLQALACLCETFSKSTILTLSAITGKRLKNSKEYLDRLLPTGRIMETEMNFGTQEYEISQFLWKDIVLGIEPEIFMPMIRFVKQELPGFGVPDFTVAFYYSFHPDLPIGQPWEKLMLMNKQQPSTFVKKIMGQMFTMDETMPMLCSLNGKFNTCLMESIITAFNTQSFDDIALKNMQHIIQHNKNFKEKERALLTIELAVNKHFLLDADPDAAAKICPPDSYVPLCMEAFKFLQKGNFNGAYKQFTAALKKNGRITFDHTILNFYYAIALTYSSKASTKNKTDRLISYGIFDSENTITMAMMLLLGREEKEKVASKAFLSATRTPLGKALAVLLCQHFKVGPNNAGTTGQILKLIEEKGMKLLQMEMSGEHKRYQNLKIGNLHPTLPVYEERAEWEVRIDKLLDLCNTSGRMNQNQHAQERIAYFVNTSTFAIQPKLQKSRDGINWSTGRNVALDALKSGEVKGMREEDYNVATSIVYQDYGWYNGAYFLGGEKAIASLIGHPCVFDEVSLAPIEVVKEKPQLCVSKKGGTFKLSSDIHACELQKEYIIKVEGNQMKVVCLNDIIRAAIKNLVPLPFPKESQAKLIHLLGILSEDMVVLGDLMMHNENIESIPVHSEIVVRLQPVSGLIRCRLLVMPFGNVPPICKPGKGMLTITTTVEGKQMQTKRNLSAEQRNMEKVLALMVNYSEDAEADDTWMLNPEECLEILEELQTMQDCSRVEWPEGERMKIARARLMPKDFNLKVSSKESWFELSGDVDISEKKKMKIAEMVSNIAQMKGHYIQLSDTEYVRITNELRQYINMLGRIATIRKGKMLVSKFNAPMLEELNENGFRLTPDKAYKNLVERISTSNTTEIRIPKNINAELRSYQKDGYLWMSRLALWGAGALLADDMGLGKTLQAITLLLSRAAQGPQLVVVPTSVSMNWHNELARFAPSLNVRMLNCQGDGRESMVRTAQAFDIVVTTYGLLSNEEQLLTSLTWNTIVLDEAHTIKNPETKTSKAAMKLHADFRLLLTGTPLQNHVSEVWNLMQFANPDLLGTFQDFNNRFLVPIERDHNKKIQQQLKRIITPFILRRTKTEVLNELPEKTEITLKVDLSADEWAFYDNLRQKALADLSDKESSTMQALAHILRLRQAACNVQLVEEGLNIPSSKLENFMALVSELHANHHRALVFSQFTSHLALVRKRLDNEGIAYLYLDGTISAKERLHLVEQFQHGDMPLFLISLKAGGQGLNLTAADYVVHLDPWWNPAIENQANDRAYRIGQHKPVTVYRLIASNTIEDKIIALQQTKKNMADALLEGSDISVNMSREEMLALLESER